MNGMSLGKVKKHVESKDEIEAMLAAEFGSKLAPVREKLKVAHKDINTYKEASKRVAQKRKAVLQPEHLRADRLRELVQAGKRRSEIATMYHFKNLKCFDERVKELDCSDLFVKQRSRTKKYA